MTRAMLLLGIVFTVLSIFISYYVINNNQEKIDLLRSQISSDEDKINEFWRKQQELEQRHAISIILYALISDKNQLDPIRIAADSYVADTMDYYGITHNANQYDKSIQLLPEKLKTVRTRTIDYINDLFANKLNLESSMRDMQKTNEIYKVIGLLMQIIGLVLVLYFKP